MNAPDFKHTLGADKDAQITEGRIAAPLAEAALYTLTIER